MESRPQDVIEFGQATEPAAETASKRASVWSWVVRGGLGLVVLTLLGGYAALAARPELSNYLAFLPDSQAASSCDVTACGSTALVEYDGADGPMCAHAASYQDAGGSCCPTSTASLMVSAGSCCSAPADSADDATVVAVAGPPAPSLPFWADESAEEDIVAEK